MSLVQATTTELRRITLAGAHCARGDAILQALAAQLTAAGQSVPVYGKLAVSLGQCADAATILQASALALAVNVTQAEYLASLENFKPLRGKPCKLSSPLPHTQLAALRRALEDPAQLPQLQEAFYAGKLRDIRLIAPLCQALLNTSHGIAMLAAQALCSVDNACLPLLEPQFNPQNPRHSIILRVLDALKSSDKLIKKTYTSACLELRTVAVSLMGRYETLHPLLNTCLLDNEKSIRLAALNATVIRGDKAALRILQSTRKHIISDERPLFDGCIKLLKLPKYARQHPDFSNFTKGGNFS
ncbi:MAG: hypothetical protein FWE06_04190 [Oscillospiraceae bacterium]|nr:hypothetical protein [Oscillospiraceae bacterium]